MSMFKVMGVKETPNPDALKFVLDKPVLETGVRQFDTAQDARQDPLASSLFALGGVESVFYMSGFIAVSKFSNRDWKVLQPKIIQTIESYSDAPQVSPAPLPLNGESLSADSNDELLGKINKVLEENVVPALAGDGGGLEVLGLDDYVLTIHYQGACGSCPSSTAGTMMAVQNLLQRMVDPRIQVIPG